MLGEASVSEWPLYFVPLADDVLSLELDETPSDLYLVCPSRLVLERHLLTYQA